MDDTIDNEDDQTLQRLIEFARGDIDTVVFEQWLYKSENIEDFLGSDLYLHLISSDYRDAFIVSGVRDIVRDFCETKHSFSCRCHTLGNL